MVYAAYGVSGLTGIVGTFFVKDYLDVSPAFLAALAFWAGIPWALKMPVGHLVDLIWRWKAALVWLGASMIAASLLIMIGLISYTEEMRAVMGPVRWYVLAALLAPTGYMIQDAVADAMTVEAVPRMDETGKPYDAQTLKSMHTTMQTLGRVAVIGGLALVAAANIYIFAGTENLPKEAKAALYANVYTAALIIPVISVLGVVLHRFLKHEREAVEKTRPNWAVLGGSLVFAAITLAVGLGGLAYAQELVLAGSLGIILFLLWRLARELEPAARQVLVATALVLFVYRSMPLTGEGSTWWMIDVLKFNEGFFAQLSLLTYALTLVGMFALRRFMAEHSIATIVVVLTVAGAILSAPIIGMYYGLHEWTAAHTGGLVDARVIALINTALESPLGQIAMVPMLAWIANSAPDRLKATFFAVMASFTNLALAAAQLGTKYLNQWFVVTREVKNASGAITTPADYSQLGTLLVLTTVVAFVVPMLAVLFVKATRFRSA
jgi:BT1 family